MSVKSCHPHKNDTRTQTIEEASAKHASRVVIQAESIALGGVLESAYANAKPHAGDHLSHLETRKKTGEHALHAFEPLEHVVRYDETEKTKRRQYASDETLASLKRLNRNMKLLVFLNDSEKPDRIDVGDMSLKNGAAYGGHQTHRSGRDVDMRAAATAYQNKSIGSFRKNPSYSREKTQVLVDMLRMDPNVKRVLFNDQEIQGVRSATGHDDHLHVSFEK